MNTDSSKLFSAEKQKHLYPISVADYFNKTKTTAYNFSIMKSIIDSNVNSSEFHNDLHILDWGCGNLLWALGLFPDAFITGVEISEDNLSYARMNAKENDSEFKFRGLLFDPDIPLTQELLFDHAMSFGLIELIDKNMFDYIFSKIFNLLKPGGKLFVTHHNYRPISAVYLPWFLRGGYKSYSKILGINISKKRSIEVIADFKNLGYSYVDSGGYCPYPSKLWPFVFSDKGYMTRNKLIKEWFYSQFIVLQKPF